MNHEFYIFTLGGLLCSMDQSEEKREEADLTFMNGRLLLKQSTTYIFLYSFICHLKSDLFDFPLDVLQLVLPLLHL